MWDDLLRVDWARLTHAYGRARNVPRILLDMVSPDATVRANGWSSFWGFVNHQGDFYDSTVAAVPFLIEAAGCRDVPGRAGMLDYFRGRWLDAPDYGGDPVLDEPPGGLDEPTPMRDDGGLASAADEPDDRDDEEIDIDSYRSMDLCAWQAGRAIRAGRATFEALLADPDRKVAAAAAELLLLWPETREAGKRTLIRTIDGEPEAVEQARRILEFGVYGDPEDVAAFEEWIAPVRPPEVRAAAILAWAWVANPGPLPGAAAGVLAELADIESEAFARLPRVGPWHLGPWLLPANAIGLILRLAGHRDADLRWRALRGLEVGSEAAKLIPELRIVPVLIRGLSDRDPRVRWAAALALSQRGESVLAIDPAAVDEMIRMLDDTEPCACGHAARWLAMVSHRLTEAQRADSLAGVERAVARFAGQQGSLVHFGSMSIIASPFLERQLEPLRKPIEWDVRRLLAEFAFLHRGDGRLTPAECDRRLADAYAGDPDATIGVAIEAVRDPVDRAVAIGAANWLMTLGPAAGSALPAVDAMDARSERERDRYARDRARAAAAFIRGALLVEPERGERGASTDAGAPSSRRGIPSLVALLTDETFVEVGIVGRYEYEGRLSHWRRERRCPRATAIDALFRIGHVPEGDRMLRAMIAESARATVVCAGGAVPHRFGIAEWRAAAEAAGGLSVAEPAVRSAWQQCRRRACSGEDPDGSALACSRELEEVVRQLSGRLV